MDSAAFQTFSPQRCRAARRRGLVSATRVLQHDVRKGAAVLVQLTAAARSKVDARRVRVPADLERLARGRELVERPAPLVAVAVMQNEAAETAASRARRQRAVQQRSSPWRRGKRAVEQGEQRVEGRGESVGEPKGLMSSFRNAIS